MSRYAAATKIRISQRQQGDLVATPAGWRHKSGKLFPTLLDAFQWPGLADGRRVHTAHDQPWMPLLETRTGAAGEIDMRTVRTIVYTVDPDGAKKAAYASRRERLAKILTAYGYTNWRFHFGRTIERFRADHGLAADVPLPYCAPHCEDHATFCREYDPPLMVMEDDAEPLWPGSHLVSPPDADRLHIGGDTHGVSLARLLAVKSAKTWRRHRGYLWQPYNRDWFRQGGMLAYHAVLYLTRHCMDTIAQYVAKRSGAVDASVAELDWKLVAYAPTRCWWWQNDGHNGEWSRNFAPPCLKRHPFL